MAIPEYHFYHGAALSLIVSTGNFTGLSRVQGIRASAYAINNSIGILIKHTTNDISPWQFNFMPDHQETARTLFRTYNDKAFIALVCGKVGVCLLKYGEYASVIDENFREQENLTVERPDGGGFRVRGAGGRFPGVIPLNRFPTYIFE
jgi:hypothetical protein